VFRQLLRDVRRSERGITGLETAIILIAFVVVATVFAFIVLTTGIFSAERGKETVFAGLQKARGTMEVRGGVIVTATPPDVDNIQFAVSTTAGGDPIPLDATATSQRTVIAYRDSTMNDNDVPYTVTVIVGDTDLLLEPGELFIVTVARTAIDGGSGPPTITANHRWTLELQTPVGAVIDLTRSMPGEIGPVMQLH
ncbi:MAG TPA: archaellin/type IV pilin N-terminal domain-containing protein, partial [Dehalococcoidia bacterium]|nr:archaellin/type IV pilin N-terminal domain-containing protein [Dehalococcoidia bacterium]